MKNIEIRNGRLQVFNDGHVPITFAKKTNDIDNCHIVIGQQRSNPSLLQTFDNVLEESLADEIYESCQRSWGTYVTLQDVEEKNNICSNTSSTCKSTSSSEEQYQYELAKKAVKTFLYSRAKSYIWKDFSNIHGVGVWVLSSTTSNEVEYHLDYAELIRYEYNIIFPPLYAGTIQCSSLTEMRGGDFFVHTGGLDHYAKHGYKCKKNPNIGVNKNHNVPMNNCWVKIPYKYNQGILHNGEYPHLSSKIISIEPGAKRRVIMGFNLFGHDVGPLVQQAPEHSMVFQRRVKLYQILNFNQDGEGKLKKGLDLEMIKQNKVLRKILLLAAQKQKKDELKMKQKELKIACVTTTDRCDYNTTIIE